MMSARSFLVSRQNQLRCDGTTTTTTNTTTTTSASTSNTTTGSPRRVAPASLSSSPPFPSVPPPRPTTIFSSSSSSSSSPSLSAATSSPAPAPGGLPARAKPHTALAPPLRSAAHGVAQKDDSPAAPGRIMSTSSQQQPPPPPGPAAPLQIPVKSKREKKPAHGGGSRLASRRLRPGDGGGSSSPSSPGHLGHLGHLGHDAAIPASVAALLAVTNIPAPRALHHHHHHRRRREMTVDSIIERTHEAEKEISLTLLSRSPLDLLLSAPEDVETDDAATLGSALSTRTVSLESMPSLVDSSSCTTGPTSSLESPSRGGRKSRPTRRPLTPVSVSVEREREHRHPLSPPRPLALDELDFRVFQVSPAGGVGGGPPGAKPQARLPLRPLKSAFKSNLTASLRALRNAARSFNLNISSLPPEDFLTRSILTLDPRIPYTDERRPPPLDEEPSAALRRYLNPTTTARLEQQPPRPPSIPPPPPGARTVFTASIQMQTYRVLRAPSSGVAAAAAAAAAAGVPRLPRRPTTTPPAAAAPTLQSRRSEPLLPSIPPGPRQRELRENSDFVRIAVMEMAMRRRGKLDDRKPGRARLALPPRKASTRTYEVGVDGVPIRWVPLSYTD